MRDEVDVLRERGEMVYSIKRLTENRRGIKFALGCKKMCENAVNLGFYQALYLSSHSTQDNMSLAYRRYPLALE